MERIKLTAELVKTDDRPETWLVEAIDLKSGDIYSAQFYNHRARARAEQYAAETFADYSVREPSTVNGR